jgi:GT2 family glycosyltransferase
MKLSVVIPNYNGEKILEKNLPKVWDSIDVPDFELVIVDDASTDNSRTVIENFTKKHSNKIKSYFNSRNLGFSSTVNKGVEISSGELVLLLNSDVVPHKGFLTPLLEDIKDENVFAVGCLDESLENNKIVERGRGIGMWEKGFIRHKAGSVDKSSTFWVSGGSGIFKKKIWNEIKGFDELYDPFYWEDIDLSYRAQKRGYAVLFEPASRVRHELESGSVKSSYSGEKIKRISYRNQFFMVWLNITDSRLLASHILWLPYNFIFSIMKGEFGFVLGFIMALSKLPTVLKHRGQRKTTSKIQDNEIMLPFSGELKAR